jgi:transcriptional antiterminator RfaH
MNERTQWYVVHTHPNAEAKALTNLLRQGFDAYLPRYKKRRRHARRITDVAAALFPRYLFVAMDVAATQWRSIHSTFGVTHLVCSGDHPVPIPAGIVEEIQSREDVTGLVDISPVCKLRPGQKVEILDGALANHYGLFEAITDDRRVAIFLNLLGRPVRVFLPEGSVAAA